VQVLAIYNHSLDERERRKSFVIEQGLLSKEEGGAGGGGESCMCVHWVAVPEPLRARRVNRRQGRIAQVGAGGEGAAPQARHLRALLALEGGGPAVSIMETAHIRLRFTYVTPVLVKKY
jgi:hypothetical protein